MREGRPKKKNDDKSEEGFETRPSKETPTLTRHPSKGRIIHHQSCTQEAHCELLWLFNDETKLQLWMKEERDELYMKWVFTAYLKNRTVELDLVIKFPKKKRR